MTSSPVLYACRTIAKGFMLSKFDSDFNISAFYEITPGGNGGLSHSCSCPSQRQPCKHIAMVEAFAEKDYIDSEWFYDPATKTWHNPLGALGTAGLEGEARPQVAEAEADELELEDDEADEDGFEPELEDEPELPLVSGAKPETELPTPSAIDPSPTKPAAGLLRRI